MLEHVDQEKFVEVVADEIQRETNYDRQACSLHQVRPVDTHEIDRTRVHETSTTFGSTVSSCAATVGKLFFMSMSVGMSVGMGVGVSGRDFAACDE